VVKIDLRQPMSEIRATLACYPIKTRLSLSGPLIVARDIAHAKLKERIDRGEGLPQYAKDHAIYYAGPAKTPVGYASGSFGPTTAGRMDSYVDLFMQHGGSFVTLAKGNRSPVVAEGLQEARRLLPGLDRRTRGDPRAGEHQEGRAARVSGARHGRPSGESRSRTSRPSSSSTTKATISSAGSDAA
jgi:hypothetical protein